MSLGNGKRLWVVLALGVAGLAVLALWQGPRFGLGGRPESGTGGPLTAVDESQSGLHGGALGASGGGALGELGVYGKVPDFHLVSQTGDSVQLANLAGRVWIGDFIFTNCQSSCPMMTQQLRRLDAALGSESRVRLVSFSVDPERDTPAKLADYAAGYGARPERWLFLTGDKAQIRKLSSDGFHLAASDAPPEDAARGADAVLHSTRLVLVDTEGRIRGYYDGIDAEAMEQLGHDIRRLLGS